MITRKEHTTQFVDSYSSTKCVGLGNNRKASLVTPRLRRQVNKKRRRLLQQYLREEIQ